MEKGCREGITIIIMCTHCVGGMVSLFTLVYFCIQLSLERTRKAMEALERFAQNLSFSSTCSSEVRASSEMLNTLRREISSAEQIAKTNVDKSHSDDSDQDSEQGNHLTKNLIYSHNVFVLFSTACR